MKAKRKTLNAGDVLAAMEEMEFERFLEPLREALDGQYTSMHTSLFTSLYFSQIRQKRSGTACAHTGCFHFMFKLLHPL